MKLTSSGTSWTLRKKRTPATAMLADLVPVRVWELRGQFSHCVLSPVHEARVRGGLCCQQTTSFLNFTPGSRIRESANSVCYKLGDGSTRQSGIAAGCVGETFRRSTQNGKPLLLALRPNRMFRTGSRGYVRQRGAQGQQSASVHPVTGRGLSSSSNAQRTSFRV